MNNKIGNVVKSTEFNQFFFIQEKTIERNKDEIKIKFGNKNIFQKIVNNLFVETAYRQGSMQYSYLSFSSIASANTPAIFYFFCPDFLQNAKCKINVSLNPSVYFSKITSQNISKTINTLTDSAESNSNLNDIFVSDYYLPPQATSGEWQGEGYSNEPEPQQEHELSSSIYIYENEEEEELQYLRHFHQYKLVGQSSTTIFDTNVYHSHFYLIKSHNHKVKFQDHQHFFSPHKHDFSTYTHNHNIDLKHSHNLENNIYFSNKIGSLSQILLDNVNISNNSEKNINTGKHTLKININGNISLVRCNIEVTGNYL